MTVVTVVTVVTIVTVVTVVTVVTLLTLVTKNPFFLLKTQIVNKLKLFSLCYKVKWTILQQTNLCPLRSSLAYF